MLTRATFRGALRRIWTAMARTPPSSSPSSIVLLVPISCVSTATRAMAPTRSNTPSMPTAIKRTPSPTTNGQRLPKSNLEPPNRGVWDTSTTTTATAWIGTKSKFPTRELWHLPPPPKLPCASAVSTFTPTMLNEPTSRGVPRKIWMDIPRTPPSSSPFPILLQAPTSSVKTVTPDKEATS